jgi:hypothetical protein
MKGAAMKNFWGLLICLLLLVQAAGAQSLGDLARKERERKAQQQTSSVQVTTDQIKKGEVDLSPALDPARTGDLDYLMDQLAHPRTTPDLLAAFIPHKGAAIPRLISMLGSTDPIKRVAPAEVLTVLGNSEGLAAMGGMLVESTEAAAEEEKTEEDAAKAAEAFRQRMEAAREADFALLATTLGVWRFTEGKELTAEQVVDRIRKGPPVEVVGGVDNGQRIFNRAFHDSDENLRRGALALIQVASGGEDYGYRPDQPPDQNQSAIQQIITFLTTERGRVMARIGTSKGRK